MIMRVGPYLYRIELVDGFIHDEGRKCLGLCDHDEQVLYVADVGSEAQQMQVLCHEYMEAWLYHFGPDLPGGVTEKERLCDLCGLAMTQFALDFMHQAKQDVSAALRADNNHIAPPVRADRAPARHRESAPCQTRTDRQRPVSVSRSEHTDADDPSRRWVVQVFDALIDRADG